MPILRNHKREQFCQLRHAGQGVLEAFVNAGFVKNQGNASRLGAEPDIIERIAELDRAGIELDAAARAEAAKAESVGLQTILQELEEARKLAKEVKQPGAMVAASMGKAKVAGLIVDKTADVTPRRTLSEIDARIRKLTERGGAARIAGLTGGAPASHERDEAHPTVSGHGTA
jgi:hypothetical protein